LRFNQKADLSSQRILKKSIFGLFIAVLCALFAAGCSSGGSEGAFIANPDGSPIGPGGGGANAGNGSVTFNFVRQQADRIVVPLTTVSLRFQFFTGLEGTGAIVKSETRPYADSVTIENVPSSARSSVVTAYTAEGFPVFQFTSNQSVPPNGEVTVGLSNGTGVPVSVESVSSSPTSVSLAVGGTFQVTIQSLFSNGETVPLSGDLTGLVFFESQDLGIATVGPDGTITGVANGTTTIEATFQGQTIIIPVAIGNGVIVPPLVTMLTITASVNGGPASNAISLPIGTVSDPIVATATFDDGSTRVVTSADGVVFQSSNNTAVMINGSDAIAVATTATTTDASLVTATFMGATSAQGISVSVNSAVLTSIVPVPATVSLPFGEFERGIAVTGNFSNATSVQLDPDQGNGVLSYAESSPNFSVDTATGLITTSVAGTPGTANLTITPTANPALAVNVPVEVGAVTVNSLSVNPTARTAAQNGAMVPGQTQVFVVTANLSNATTVDVSDFAALNIMANQAPTSLDIDVSASGKQAVAVSSTPTGEQANVTFSMDNVGPGGSTISQVVPIEVLGEVLTSVRYLFGGNEVNPQLTVNLPRGYVGVFEVEGTFNTGAVRKLFPYEYAIIADPRDSDNDTTANPGTDPEALQLFDNTFTTLDVDPVTASLTNGTGLFFTVPVDPPPGTESLEVVDDIYGDTQRTTVATATIAAPGSDNTTIVTRPTFKAVAADWRRGEMTSGAPQGLGPAGPVNFPLSVSQDLGTSPGGGTLSAPGSQRYFGVVVLLPTDPSLPNGPNYENTMTPDPMIGTRPFGGASGKLDQVISVTVTDYDQVTIVSSGFVNYPTENFIPRASVREFEVRVNFTGVGGGFNVGPLNNFKLAEANVNLRNNGFRQASTAIGFPAIFANVPVDVALIRVDSQPLCGVAGLPFMNGAPGIARNDTSDITDDAYQPGAYAFIPNTYGVTSAVSTFEVDGGPSLRDPGPAPAFNYDLATQRVAEPVDGFTTASVTGNGGAGITVVSPNLFSLDPINVPAATPLDIGIGVSRVFRTLVQFRSVDPIVDRSLDYPPQLFADFNIDPSSEMPSAVFIADTGAPGRIRVSAVAQVGMGAVAVDSTDVDNQSGDTILALTADVVAALAQTPDAMVMALDASGRPIEERGSFQAGTQDSLGQVGPAQSVTTVNTVAAP
jgi:Bacterial Ig-like domain (group 2)